MDSDYDFEAPPSLHFDVLNSQARSCCMLIKLLKIDIDMQSTDSLDSISFNDAYTWINSFCMLPVLVDGKITLCNGHSILIYLCQKYGNSNLKNLCPCDYKKRIKLTSMLFYEGCILQRYLTHLMTDIILGTYSNLNVEYHKGKVLTVYTSLNSFLNGQSFLTGSRLTIADISVVSTVSAFNIIFPIDYNMFPNLFDWFQTLKKMPFYTCNDEGIHKLLHLLKNIGRFPFPSPLSIEQSESREFDFEQVNNKNGEHKSSIESTNRDNNGKRNNSSGSVDTENNEKPKYSVDSTDRASNGKRKNSSEKHKNSSDSIAKVSNNQYRNSFEPIENIANIEADEIRQSAECENLSDTGKMEYNEGNGNDKDKQESDKVKFFDTYFINVRKCNCCSRIVTKDKMYYNPYNTPRNGEQKRDSKETQEIFRRVEQHEPSGSSVDTFCQPENWNLPSHYINNATVEDSSFCSCSNECCKTAETAVEKRGPSRGFTDKEKETELSSVQSIENDRPNTRVSGDEEEERSSKQHDEVTPSNSSEKNAIENDNNDINIAMVEEMEIDRDKEAQCDFGIPNECLFLTNQKVQDLMKKIEKYEKILEMSDKALMCTNSILAKIPSNIASIDSVLAAAEKKLPQKSGAAICTCCQCCKCWTNKKEKEEEEIKAVEADDEIAINTSVTSVISISSQNEKQESERLEAGCNSNPYKSLSIEHYHPRTSVKIKHRNLDSDDDYSSDICGEKGEIIYIICSKNKCKNEIKCSCDDCGKEDKITNSKIPRLLSNKSLLNVKNYKLSNKDSFRNIKHVR